MLSPADVADVRLPVALRGYRFAETDLLLDRLGEELKLRDAEISALRSGEPWPPSEIVPAFPDESFQPPSDQEVSNSEAPNPEPGLEL
jgi:DivIVA domain-containing protein